MYLGEWLAAIHPVAEDRLCAIQFNSITESAHMEQSHFGTCTPFATRHKMQF